MIYNRGKLRYTMESWSERPRYSEAEVRHLLRKLLEREARTLLKTTKNAETKKFAEKALALLALKESIENEAHGQPRSERRQERIDPPRQDTARSRDASAADVSGGVTRQLPRQFGIFWAVEAVADEGMQDQESGFSLEKGDYYIELHLPPVRPEDQTTNSVRSSLRSLAQYIDSNDLAPKYVMGVTYEKIANVAKGVGFSVINPDLPTDLRESVERFNRTAVRDGLKDEPMGQLVLAYQGGEAFLNRFAPKK